ncbi:MAG TPA: hypothetical protein PK228_15425 [Saprospiraceae bacterium]|nr:hypothetical protein [Saprospiraceae bacterium]
MNNDKRPSFDNPEAYLAGELTPGEQAIWDAELAQNPDLRAEVERLRELGEHLHTLRIEERVAQALRAHPAQEPPPTKRVRQKKWGLPVFLLSLAFLVTGGFAWWFTRPRTAPPAEPAPQSAPPPQQQSPPPAPAPLLETKPSPSKPIAQNSPTVPAMPNMRGQGDPLPAELQRLLESVWFTAYDTLAAHYASRFQPAVAALTRQDYPAAFVALRPLEKATPGNDTLAYLKGICLLEMGEGAEAARYFSRMDSPGQQRQAEALWLSGLGYLLAGEKEKARAAWIKVSALHAPLYPQKAKESLRQL